MTCSCVVRGRRRRLGDGYKKTLGLLQITRKSFKRLLLFMKVKIVNRFPRGLILILMSDKDSTVLGNRCQPTLS